jgi:hypothetical protein
MTRIVLLSAIALAIALTAPGTTIATGPGGQISLAIDPQEQQTNDHLGIGGRILVVLVVLSFVAVLGCDSPFPLIAWVTIAAIVGYVFQLF